MCLDPGASALLSRRRHPPTAFPGASLGARGNPARECVPHIPRSGLVMNARSRTANVAGVFYLITEVSAIAGLLLGFVTSAKVR